MKITISKSQWEEMGRKAGWIDKTKAYMNNVIDKLNSILPESQVEMTISSDLVDWLRNYAIKLGLQIIEEVKVGDDTRFILKKPFITKSAI